MKTQLTPCPRCGYENRPSAHRCGLCSEPFIISKADIRLAATTVSSRRVDGEDAVIPLRRDYAAEMRGNRIRSGVLLAVCFSLLAAMGFALGGWYGYPEFGAITGLGIGALVVLWAWFSGDKAVLELSEAQPSDAVRERQLINIVDEMRIAAGLPMPQVRVIESDALNAFASGRDPQHATVAVTRGLLEKLNREELQGVVAHEVGHIRNLDIRYMMLVAALVGVIVIISDLGGRGMRFGGRGRSIRGGGRGGGHPIFAIIAILLMILAPLFATLLQMAISRRREFLADASAAELTRNPLGLASALEKIDASLDYSPLPGASKATQHLYIANPFKRFGMRASALMSTHPPMEARIKLLRAMAI